MRQKLYLLHYLYVLSFNFTIGKSNVVKWMMVKKSNFNIDIL